MFQAAEYPSRYCPKTINDMGLQSLICSHAVRLTFAKAVLFRYSVVVRRCQRSLSCM